MVGPINPTVAGLLFGQTSGGGSSFGLDAETLSAWASAKIGPTVDRKELEKDPNAPAATIWEPGISPSRAAYLQRALDGKSFFDTNVKLYSDLGADGDYRRLFALYSGVTTLQALADRAETKDISRTDKLQVTRAFDRGLKELESFFATQKFDDVRLAQGDRVEAAQTTLGLPVESEDYTTGIVHRGSLADTVMGLDRNAQFRIVATATDGTQRTVTIDLSEMRSIPRSLGNVISFVNGELAAGNVATRLAAVDQTPKKSTLVIGGRTIESRYIGPKQYALKVDVKNAERVSFEPIGGQPAFYAVGAVTAGARLVKLTDVDGAAGQPVKLERPAATADAVGGNIGAGWLGGAPTGVYEKRTNLMFSPEVSDKIVENNFEEAIRNAGEAVLRMTFDDGRVLTLSTAWQSDDREAWRVRTGESEDEGMARDLAERLTQLLHEQGVAAGVGVYATGPSYGLSIKTGDFVRDVTLAIGGRNATFTDIKPTMVGGLRDGIAARRFEAASIAATGAMFVGEQTFDITAGGTPYEIVIDGGDDGIDAATLISRLNTQLHDRRIQAAATIVDNNGVLDIQFDALHSVTAVSLHTSTEVGATTTEADHTANLLAPGTWAEGGLPNAAAGQPFGDAIREYSVTGGSPLLSEPADLDIDIVIATAAGNRTVNVVVSAAERSANPDPQPGEWDAMFQQRLDAALNAAGVYVDAVGSDLTSWRVAEGVGQRLLSISVNGNAVNFEGAAPAGGIGGAFSVERSLTSAQIAATSTDAIAALAGDHTLSVTFDTIWGSRTVSTALQGGDAQDLDTVALRLNEAIVAAGYDLGVAVESISGGGVGLRFVTGASHSVRNVTASSIGGVAHAVTLDPVDAATHSANPVGAARVATRADRGAAALETLPSASTFIAPSVNSSGWFAGRSWDMSVGGGAKLATARAVATGGDGSVFVLADLDGDSATSPIKGSRDVALLKYDSAGKLIFTEILGATQSANGFALAVAADGKVAVAGSVEGGLSNADAARGGLDSFVSVFDATGKELWTVRRGATTNDEARAVSFTADGAVIVAGKTDSALGPVLSLGGADGYVRGFSSTGTELFTRQFGTSGADAATALLVRAPSQGVVEIFTAGVESSRGVVRRFTYTANNGLTAGATRDIGYFHTGGINALAADGTSLYVGGEIGADRLALGTPARGSVAGGEGFVARVNADLTATDLDRATYVGSAQEDSVKSLAIVGGEVYAAGVTGGVLDGRGTGKLKASFLTRLDDQGALAWTRTFNSSAGGFSLNAMAADVTGVSPLDVLGLPKGRVAVADTAALASRSSLRVGDEFRIGADGRLATRIRIEANDSLLSLATRINRAIGSAGRAEIVRAEGVERIKISPRGGAAIRIHPGKDGADALPTLGLTPGVIANNAQVSLGGMKTFGLGLIAQDLKLGTAAEITRTKAELSAAGSIIRQAYEAVAYPKAKEPTAEDKALNERRQNAGAAPAYLTAQTAGYQAALLRLRGY